MAQEWLRLYREVIHDPKLRKASAEVRWLWISLLCLADDDGLVRMAEGTAYKPDDLADIARIPIESVVEGMQLFSGLKMIEEVSSAVVIEKWARRQFKSDSSTERVRNFRDLHKGEKAKRFRNVSETPPEQNRAEQSIEETYCEEAPREPSSPVVLVFDCNGSPNAWPLTQAKVSQYQELYPGLDVLFEAKKARQWCIDNPARRKTARGMTKYLNGWLSRANDRHVPAAQGQDVMTTGPHAGTPIMRGL